LQWARISSPQILGDSKLLIDWTNVINNLQNLTLIPIVEKIREERNRIGYVLFQQVYRELNETADKLSKETLVLQERKIVIVETDETRSLPQEVISLY
jgi:hypothetical protein